MAESWDSASVTNKSFDFCPHVAGVEEDFLLASENN